MRPLESIGSEAIQDFVDERFVLDFRPGTIAGKSDKQLFALTANTVFQNRREQLKRATRIEIPNHTAVVTVPEPHMLRHALVAEKPVFGRVDLSVPQRKTNRSRSITFAHAATKSRTNLPSLSLWA